MRTWHLPIRAVENETVSRPRWFRDSRGSDAPLYCLRQSGTLSGCGHFVTLNPGVSLCSTPGYGLASLRDALAPDSGLSAGTLRDEGQ